MLVETVVLGMFILFLTRKRHNFQFEDFKGLPFLWASILIEQIAQVLLKWGVHPVLTYTLPIHSAVYLCLFGFIWSNYKTYKSMIVVGIGCFLNALVVVLNAGFMPVSDYLAYKYGYFKTLESLTNFEVFGHALTGVSTKFVFLSDWIAIGPPYFFPKTVSIGDLVIDLGIIILVYGLSKGKGSTSHLEVENVG
jgi:hypothetical protein